jgi:hypothetical protein
MSQKSIVTVVDWSTEQGARLAPVDIPQDSKDMKRLVRKLRETARRRAVHLMTTNIVLHQDALDLQNLHRQGALPEVGLAVSARLSLVSHRPTQKELFQMYWPKISRYHRMDADRCLHMLSTMKKAHGWMAAMEGIHKEILRLVSRPGTMPPY